MTIERNDALTSHDGDQSEGAPTEEMGALDGSARHRDGSVDPKGREAGDMHEPLGPCQGASSPARRSSEAAGGPSMTDDETFGEGPGRTATAGAIPAAEAPTEGGRPGGPPQDHRTGWRSGSAGGPPTYVSTPPPYEAAYFRQPVQLVRPSGPNAPTIIFGLFLAVIGLASLLAGIFFGWFDFDAGLFATVCCGVLGAFLLLAGLVWGLVSWMNKHGRGSRQ
ncbi:hypothetical protein [Bifidobacterium xylocopae]|uniref:Uncharacterized protein n=1 Tax=Bifidobacterium xylocopae TaxID=2493119 RepID=A0A366KDJ5_9BIFI|nr:hypothetical protein [Bifidobacterium xylocopae]RBP99774.1 hypothetical protein CRD59_01675 [Bifidobacterium xylocopae]